MPSGFQVAQILCNKGADYRVIRRGLSWMVPEGGCNGPYRGPGPNVTPPSPPWLTFLGGFPEVGSWLIWLSGL